MLKRALLSLAAVLALAPPAVGQDVVLTAVPEITQLSAYGGHVVWSVPVAGGYGLVHWHDGQVEPLPVAPRPLPFDVDVGSDERGRAVALYSRCRHEPALDDPDAWAVAGCDVFAYPLERASGERLVRSVSRRSWSEIKPSMWRGAIAFARRRPRDPVTRLYVRRPGARRATRLAGGSVPTCEDAVARCRTRTWVEGIDLGRRNAAVLWWMADLDGFTPTGYELLVASRDGRRSRLAHSRFVGGACDVDHPRSPSATGAGVTYLQMRGDCAFKMGATFVIDDPVRRMRRQWITPPGVFAYRLARDGDAFYWMRGSIQGCPCELVRSVGLPFERVDRPPVRPLLKPPRAPDGRGKAGS